uniref:folliculin-interacting protein 2-like isoform X2 n=1 Tax=Ciona intestinalis TaxID=7719 RepID=UPI000180B35F|nr:folliculin-interacting protein 2-like isoform X2 [Ciona intestinalis]|eukprot:XP_026694825.1 folliculin-interacting protein 2-like isoform X2 [Ciona intestinalis]
MENMFQKLQKKILVSERKLNSRLSKCSLFSKPRILNHSMSPVVSPAVETPLCDETMVVVERPAPNVRLVLFKEFGDTSDRKIVFDSKSLQQEKNIEQQQQQQQQQQEQKPQYQYVRTPADWDMLSEMLFGSVGMAHKVASIKIHYVKSPPQIMLSRVFCLPSLKDAATVSLDRGMENHLEMQRSNAVSSRRKANTMPVPSPVRSHTPQPINRLPRSDSSSSLTNFFANPYLLHSSTGSLGTTKIQIPSIHNKSHSLPKHQRDSFTLHEEINEKSVPFRRGKLRIGFAVLCEPEPSNAKAFRQFFFEHFPIIETHMTKLKNDIEQAFKFQPKQEFYHSMMKALSTFTLSLQTLYSTPRLPEPVWSTLQCPTTSTHQRSVVVNCFMGDLVRLVAHCNSKQKNCFFTGLLTSVLTHHLGWVSSATPSNGGNEPQENYNALWVQLGDLYGAVGSPTKVCRTVVTGSNHESVSTVLSVLSYFIRSARVDDVVPVPEKITPASLGVPTTVPVKNIRTNLVESELEDDEYVLVSVDDDVTMSQGTSSNSMTSSCSMTSSSSMTSSKNTMASSNIMTSSNSVTSSSALTSLKNNMTSSSTTTSSGMMTSSNRNNIHRSTSSPNASYTGDSPLLRTYSGPIKRRGNYPISGLRAPDRQRTYSNDGLLRHRGIQSRRKSHDTTCDKVAVESMVRSSTSTLSLNAISSNHRIILNKPDDVAAFELKLPEIPTHQPGCEPTIRNKPIPAKKLPTKDDAPCKEIETHAMHLEPRVQNVLNVQRACVELKTPPKLPTFAPNTKPPVPTEPRPPIRSVSNPSVVARDTIQPNLRRISSNCGAKVRVGARRQKLPCSPPPSGNYESESPSFQRIELMRIPSIEINHNAFDEYFNNSDDEQDETISKQDGTFIERQTFTAVPTNQLPSTIYPKLDTQSPTQNMQAPTSPTPLPRSPKHPISPTTPHPTYPPTPHTETPKVAIPKLYPTLPTAGDTNPQPREFPIPRPRDLPLPSLTPTNTYTPCSFKHSNDITFRELPLSDVIDDEDKPNKPRTDSVGFDSLMADYNPEYLTDFVLHGSHDHPDMHERILQDLDHMTRIPSLDEPVAEAVCILADTENWTVKVYSSQRLHSERPSLPALTSKLVGSILQRTAHLYNHKMSAQFCLENLERELRQLVLKSRMLAEYVRGIKRVTVDQLSAVLNIESQDIPLLMAIASCHSPHVAPVML